jgi:flagellar export protein FliJ
VRFIALMDLRRRTEDECRRTVGRLERQRADQIASREALVAERAATAASAIDPALHEVFAAYWRRIEVALHDHDRRIAQTDAEIVKARAELVEAHRATTVIGKLQDLDRRAMARAADRRERRHMDEFAASRHTIASTAGGATP